MFKMRRPHGVGIVAVLVIFAVLVTACGNDGVDSSSTVPPDQPTASDIEGRQAAQQAVQNAKAPVSFIDPGGPVNVAPYRGQTLWVVSADLSIPFHQNIVAGFNAGAEAAGLEPVEFDGKGKTAEMARGIEQAVSQNAAGIALISIDTRFVQGAITQANEAGIPVIGVLNTDARADLDEGTAGEATIDYTGSGELLAAYAIANTDGPVHGLYADVSEFRVMGFLKEGIELGFTTYCPDTCSVQTYDVQMADFKTQVQTKTQSELRRNPDTSWVLSAFDAQALFVVPSITEAGFKDQVRVGSINAVTANLEFILQDNVQVVDVGNSNAWLGWAAADRLLRALNGDEGISEVPIRLFDKENLQGVDVSDEDELFGGVDFRASYQELWK